MPTNMNKIENDLKQFPEKLYQSMDNLTRPQDCRIGITPAEVIYTEDKVKLLRYRPVVDLEQRHPTPLLIVYALVNRHEMLDLQPGRSFIQNLLDQGLDVYLIDWGFASRAEQYLDMGDYIEGYLNTIVERVRTDSQKEKVNLLGVCMGGTMGTIYAALHPEKIKNLITFVTPIDCNIDEGLLFTWAKASDVDRAVDIMGNIPGDLLNVLYSLLTPIRSIDKYVQFVNKLENSKAVNNFLRMEKWIYNSPDVPAEVFREYVRNIFQNNLLIKNELNVGGKPVDLKKITMPLLNVSATHDHIVPPTSSKPLLEAVGSTDTTHLEFNTGHIGIFVGGSSQKTVAPAVCDWIKAR